MTVVLLAAMAIALGWLLLIAINRKSRDLQERIDDLEDQLAKRRHTYPTVEGLEDGMAVAIELLLRYEAEAAYTNKRMDQLRDILGRVRAGPLEYEARPNGRVRKTYREKN